MNKKEWVYDIEVFKNFFCVTFLNTKDPAELKTFTICLDLKLNEVDKLKSFVDNEVSLMIGYNNIFYDNQILEFVYNYNDSQINKEVYDLSQHIISTDRGEGFGGYRKNYIWNQLDLMKIMAFDKTGVSLKQCAINLKWKKIQDLPLPYDHIVTKLEEVEIIIKYNINDVLISYKLYEVLSEEINLRQDLSKIYESNLTNASDSKIANILLEKFYTEETGVPIQKIRNLRTPREFLWLRDCIANGITFKTKKLLELMYEIAGTLVVKENNYAFKKNIEFSNCNYEIGIGGLHSVDAPNKFVKTDNSKIISADVGSFYPNIMINNRIKPEHLGEDFVEILKKLTTERLGAKKKKEKVKADGLKIVVNSIFGKLGSDIFWLYDPKAFLTVTVSGQLYLLTLIEALALEGINVISANTDGIECIVSNDLEDKYYEICEQWQKQYNFSLEFVEYDVYVKSDVNNYISKDAKTGKTKEKGRYITKLDLRKGYHYPIVPKAMYSYFINKTPVENTILACDQILDFCLSQKTGKEFVLEYRYDNTVEILQKTNRYYISNTGGKLVKVHKEKGTEINLCANNLAKVINDYDDSISIDSYDVDIDYYIKETYKYIKEVENGKFPKEVLSEELAEEKDYVPLEMLPIGSISIETATIEPARFRHSNYSYTFDRENNIIHKGIGSIKFINKNVSNDINKIVDKQFETFVDFLIYSEENMSINSKQMDILIRANYFLEFGNNLKLLQMFEEFTKGKNKYTKTLIQKTKDIRKEKLLEFFQTLDNKKLSVVDQLKFDIEHFGEIQTLLNIPKNYVIVTALESLQYSPRVSVYCFYNGKYGSFKIKKALFANKLFEKNSVLYCVKFSKEPAVMKVNEEWIPTGKDQHWLTAYNVIKLEEFDSIIQKL